MVELPDESQYSRLLHIWETRGLWRPIRYLIALGNPGTGTRGNERRTLDHSVGGDDLFGGSMSLSVRHRSGPSNCTVVRRVDARVI